MVILSGLLAVPAAAIVAVVAASRAWRRDRPPEAISMPPQRGTRAVEDVLRDLGPGAEARLRPRVAAAGLPYPPPRLALLAFKAEKRLELWGATPAGAWARIRDYPILAASGSAGPKLREGDRQVPEGIYRIDALNPNSAYHLSMRLDYPNAFDRAQARREGRSNLGGDIFIHGSDRSIGCLALGDEAIEELFVLVARAGRDRAEVVIAPNDLRGGRPAAANRPDLPWLGALYDAITTALRPFE
jgi:hypothetical protein